MPPDEQPVGSMAVGLAVDTLATAVCIVWGFAALGAAVLAPGLIGTLPTPVSAGGMALLGLLVLWAVYRNSRLLFGVLALLTIGVAVGSWTGTIQWAVPYESGLAAVSMAGVAFIVAVALVFKTIQLIDIGVEVSADVEQ